MVVKLSEIIDLKSCKIFDPAFHIECRERLNRDGILVLPNFLTPESLAETIAESRREENRAYFCNQDHSVYLTKPDRAFGDKHPINRMVVSSKGCICDDQISSQSPLRLLYESGVFQDFICAVTGEEAIYRYGDNLSSINVHYARRGQELGWHFDNSSFAITLLIQKPEAGSVFEYVRDLRDADAGEMNFSGVRKLLDGHLTPEQLSMEPGTLVLFRGRNSAHRVTPNESDKTRILAVLAYNSEPGIALSDNARMTFYGRLN